MNKILNFLKFELSGWSNTEKIIAPSLLLILILLSLYMNDSPIATIQASFSFLYTIFAGKGKISCYVFGIFGTICYSYLSFKNNLFGNLLLHLGYFFPMEIIGIFSWRNKLKETNREVIKTKLNYKLRIIYSIVIILAALIFSCILRLLNDKFPILDAFTTVLSIAAMYFTIIRCIEQWILWTIVNILSVIMWLMIFIHGSNTFATMFIWLIHLFLGIYFYFQWKKEVK